MEIPQELLGLYKHWNKHLQKAQGGISRKENIDETLLKSVTESAAERMRIWDRKYKGEAAPFTDDLILQRYRFCNIYRELDRQTIELHTMFKKLESDPELWLLNALFFRFVANPETIRKVGLLSFDEKNNQKVMERLAALPSPKYGVPYVFPISILQRSSWPTRETFFCLYLPKVASKLAWYLLSGKERSVCEAVKGAIEALGFPFRFHLTEVIIDFAYQYPGTIDLFKKFPAGPGSKGILEMLCDTLPPEDTASYLATFTMPSFPYLTIGGNPVFLSAENWEGICCEYRKYSNLSKGLGRKRIYNKK